MDNGVYCDPILAPAITAVKPLVAVLGLETVFTITGVNLPATLAAKVDNCDALHFTNRTEEEQLFVCTPSKNGIAARQIYLAPGGEQVWEDEVVFECPDCTMESTCVAHGEAHPENPCLVCDIEQSLDNWSPGDGAACDDGASCNGVDQCEGGTCSIHASCHQRECGDDGCGGTCGVCACGEECADGQCEFTSCDTRMCGDDGCGNECPSECTEEQHCEVNQCVDNPVTCGDNECDGWEDKCTCAADCGDPCEGKFCGPDGCGGNCGTCMDGESCQDDGQCVVECGDGLCGAGENQCNCPGDCAAGCPGCCSGNECKDGLLSTDCGKNGDVCWSCTDGQTCQNQVCEYKCGDGVCASLGNENCATCAADCGGCCGNGACDNGEASATCPTDCPVVTQGFVTIGAHSFWMGTPSGCPGPEGYPGTCAAELGRETDEVLHYVTLTHTFEIQIFEVTQGDWMAAYGNWNPSYYPLCGSNCPVEQVTWYEAAAYANTKSLEAGKTPCYLFAEVICKEGGNPPIATNYAFCMNTTHGGINSATVTLNGVDTPHDCTGYRLPTESEWEYAVRAGSTTALYPSEGNDGSITQLFWDALDPNLDMIAWYSVNETTLGTKPVGGKAANLWGLKDMSGNAREWCWDKCGMYPPGTVATPSVNPTGFVSPLERVMRGGSYGTSARGCRSGSRSSSLPDTRVRSMGLRLCRSIDN